MTDKVLKITDKEKALTFIRRAACDGSICDDVSIVNTSIADLTDAEAKALLAANGLEVEPGMKVKFIVDTEDTMHIRIPYFGRVPQVPAGQADPVGEAKPGAGGPAMEDSMADYTYLHPELGEIYKNAYSGGGYGGGGADEVLEFNNARLLDYAISNCK